VLSEAMSMKGPLCKKGGYCTYFEAFHDKTGVTQDRNTPTRILHPMVQRNYRFNFIFQKQNKLSSSSLYLSPPLRSQNTQNTLFAIVAPLSPTIFQV